MVKGLKCRDIRVFLGWIFKFLKMCWCKKFDKYHVCTASIFLSFLFKALLSRTLRVLYLLHFWICHMRSVDLDSSQDQNTRIGQVWKSLFTGLPLTNLMQLLPTTKKQYKNLSFRLYCPLKDFIPIVLWEEAFKKLCGCVSNGLWRVFHCLSPPPWIPRPPVGDLAIPKMMKLLQNIGFICHLAQRGL